MTHELEESLPASTPYERLGGESRVRELTQRFYFLMDSEVAYQELRAVHGPDLSRAQERLFWFLSGWALKRISKTNSLRVFSKQRTGCATFETNAQVVDFSDCGLAGDNETRAAPYKAPLSKTTSAPAPPSDALA